MFLFKSFSSYISYKPSMKLHSSSKIDIGLKNLLNAASQDFAWQILQLQIQLQCELPSHSSLIQLIQLYMLGVEVLENEDDPRYNYFNNKIHALVMKKSVLEQLHKIATGTAPDPHAIEQAQLLELEKRKSQIQLQMTLQKDQYTVASIKDMIRKGENHTQRKNKRIQENIEEQNMVLQNRIKTRKLRSLSRGKLDHEELSPPMVKVVSKAAYGVSVEADPPQQQRVKSRYRGKNG